jgi:hypothetical protein
MKDLKESISFYRRTIINTSLSTGIIQFSTQKLYQLITFLLNINAALMWDFKLFRNTTYYYPSFRMHRTHKAASLNHTFFVRTTITLLTFGPFLLKLIVWENVWNVTNATSNTDTCCSLITFKVIIKQFTLLPPDFTTYFGQNQNASYQRASRRSIIFFFFFFLLIFYLSY